METGRRLAIKKRKKVGMMGLEVEVGGPAKPGGRELADGGLWGWYEKKSGGRCWLAGWRRKGRCWRPGV